MGRTTVKNSTRGDSADLLADLQEIKLKLESGKSVRLNIAKEVSIPESDTHRHRELMKAPARLAFWSYQRDRSLRKVREQENELAKITAEASMSVRLMLDSGHWEPALEHDYSSKTYGLLDRMTDQQEPVVNARQELVRLRYEHDVLNSITRAVEQKCFALRRLLAFDPERAL